MGPGTVPGFPFFFDGITLQVGARWYSPHLIRWMSRDPIHYRGGDNLSAYVMGNPVKYVDPSGLEPFDHFMTFDQAVTDLRRFVLSKSIRHNREMGGWIYRDPHTKMYYYDDPEIFFEHSTIAKDPKLPGACGRYHTHGAESGENWEDELVSPQDTRICKEYRAVRFGQGVPREFLRCLLFTPSNKTIEY